MVDVLVIGGGSAGMAAALAAKKSGAGQVLLVERDRELGGVLNQCIHSGFGLHHFKEELTGPQYAHRFVQEVSRFDITVLLNTTVLRVTPLWIADQAKTAQEPERLALQEGARPLEVVLIQEQGCQTLVAKAVILAMGCRERTAGAISLQGYRPSGILTAGAAQRLINMEGLSIGQDVVIYGSGDIGLIMARRLTLEGCRVHKVIEILPHCSGLRRNEEQCLHDFGIPLLLSHAITAVHGKHRVCAVSAAPVDATGQILKEQERTIPCDTLLLSVGLLPENELTRGAGAAIDPATKGPLVLHHLETTVPGLFACGNVLHVHDLVDFVTQEAQEAGRQAAAYALGQTFLTRETSALPKAPRTSHPRAQEKAAASSQMSASPRNQAPEKFTAPAQKVFSPHREARMETKLSPKNSASPNSKTPEGTSASRKASFTCTICPQGCLLTAEQTSKGIFVTGNCCPRGIAYGEKELLCPSRLLTTTVPVRGGILPVVPVITLSSVPVLRLKKAALFLKGQQLQAPLKEGQVISCSMEDLDLSFQITRDLPEERLPAREGLSSPSTGEEK